MEDSPGVNTWSNLMDHTAKLCLRLLLTQRKVVAEENLFTLTRLYHHHKTTPVYVRVSYVQDCFEQIVRYAVVQY